MICHLHKTLILLVMLIQARASANKLSQTSKQQVVISKAGIEGRSFFYDRWADRDDLDSNLIEDMNSNHLTNGSLTQDYACGRSIFDKKFKDLSSMGEQPNNHFTVTRNKYRPTEIRMPRIIGGDETAPGEFPWTVSVKLNGQPICGGSLIERSWILTAAHCVVGYNPKNLTIRLGAYRIKDTTESQTVDLPISMFIVHKEYSMPRPFSNDIALLKLIEPVDYTDFIIPICLPKEDHSLTSSLNVVGSSVQSANDYNMKRLGSMSSSMTAARDKETDTGGIVVSTKMSDNDIAKCFNRLEQNYLNSIGLGSINPSESEVAASESQQHKHKLPLASFATTTTTTEASSISGSSATINSFLPAPAPTGMLFPIETLIDLIDPSIHHIGGSSSSSGGANGGMNGQPQSHQEEQSQRFHSSAGSGSSLNNRVTFQQKPSEQNFEGPTYAALQQAIQTTVNSYANHNAQNNQDQIRQQGNEDYTIYYNLPWGRRKESPPSDSRRETVKLSKLPISKELLREIQSVGSGSMQTLGLHQGDFMAMANDLTSGGAGSSSSHDHQTNNFSQDKERASIAPLAAANTRHGSNSLLRSTLTDDVDDPSRYSGMSGIVVGWGWVREQDGDESLNKGYPSVTLQKVKLPILRNNVCEAWFQSQAKKITLLPSQFCAGFNSGGKDACRGDSGGPMIIEDNSETGRYQLIGIVSAGIGCARPSLPGLYTRVASFLPWIKAQIARY